jgi:short-subunit dehydrogenase
VTGASGGLGAAIVRRLVRDGASVVMTGRRSDVLESLRAETGAEVIVADLADRSDVTSLLDVAATVNVLVANAALPATGPLDDFTIEEIDRALDVNLRAPVLLARAAATGMAGRGHGHIVFISSMAAKTSGPSIGLYAATKAGLRGLSLSMREDLRPAGVGVSVILPGPISDAGMWADAAIKTPPGIRLRSPETVAAAVVEAVVRNRAELDVASFGIRVAAGFAQLRPAWFAAIARRSAGRHAEAMTAAHRATR